MKTSTPAVSLLLKNIRLLDIPDLSSDVLITAETLTSGKNKSKIFEHITYHLFYFYSPEGCESKFQSCWPVFEPAQAKAFRAVALSWFMDLKRTGELPGNTVVRKSTLEDCQGERYEELMLAFSTFVLHSVMENKNAHKSIGIAPWKGRTHFDTFIRSIVYRLATDDHASVEDLQPLIFSYQSSLANVVQQRSSEKMQWGKFQALLMEEEGKIESRLSLEPANSISALSTHDKSTFQRWRSNWITDESLLDHIISKGSDYEPGGVLRLGFSNALRTMTSSDGRRIDGLHPAESLGSDPTDGLMAAVSAQRSRLQRWRTHPSYRNLRDGAWKGGSSAFKYNDTSKSIGEHVNFEKHQGLSVFDSSAGHSKSDELEAVGRKTQLELIMDDFDRDLSHAS